MIKPSPAATTAPGPGEWAAGEGFELSHGAEGENSYAPGRASTTTRLEGNAAALFSSGRQNQTLRRISCHIRPVTSIKAATHNAGDDDGRLRCTRMGEDVDQAVEGWKGAMTALFISGRQHQMRRCVSCDIRPVNSIKAATHNAGDGDDQRAQPGVRGQDPGACLTTVCAGRSTMRANIFHGRTLGEKPHIFQRRAEEGVNRLRPQKFDDESDVSYYCRGTEYELGGAARGHRDEPFSARYATPFNTSKTQVRGEQARLIPHCRTMPGSDGVAGATRVHSQLNDVVVNLHRDRRDSPLVRAGLGGTKTSTGLTRKTSWAERWRARDRSTVAGARAVSGHRRRDEKRKRR